MLTKAEQKSLVLTYLKAFDNGGTAPDGRSILELFADDAEVYFPKWGIARGLTEIERLFSDVGAGIIEIRHRYDTVRWVLADGPLLAAEGESDGVHRDGAWRAGEPESGAGRWCDVFEFAGKKISRCYIYLDPDYGGRDTARYQWLTAR
ncbi:nuclear transport factor 2 family protein [Leisingera sp. D0M16]|uniref:nuclear transport factor 2 family protein n=1 Tax=Leisingera coralii TaxID=3351347 RepID=UPI003B81801F